MRVVKQKGRPRVYITLKDAITGKVRGLTIDEANLPQVLKKIIETFSDPSAALPSRGPASPEELAASTEPLPETASAGA